MNILAAIFAIAESVELRSTTAVCHQSQQLEIHSCIVYIFSKFITLEDILIRLSDVHLSIYMAGVLESFTLIIHIVPLLRYHPVSSKSSD